jgi:hypothetical protein
MPTDTSPPTASLVTALVRTYLATLVIGLPLAAVMLTPGLMRSRVAYLPGLSWLGIVAFLVLSALVVATSIMVSARVAPADGWRMSSVRAASRSMRRSQPRKWWQRVGEAALIFAASQLFGGYIAWLMPHIWPASSSTADTSVWELSYPNFATQAVTMYLVICLAAAWFGTRIRQLTIAGSGRNAAQATRTGSPRRPWPQRGKRAFGS